MVEDAPVRRHRYELGSDATAGGMSMSPYSKLVRLGGGLCWQLGAGDESISAAFAAGILAGWPVPDIQP